MSSQRLAQSIRTYATAVSTPTKRSKLALSPIPASSSQLNTALAGKKRIRRDPKRPYPARKAHIYAQYTSLITQPVPLRAPASEATTETTEKQNLPAVLLISHENFTVSAFTKLRGDLAAAVSRLQTTRDKMAAAKGEEALSTQRLSVRFQILRPALFLPVVRKAAGKAQARKLERLFKGPIAAVILSGTTSVDPQLLSTVLRVVDKAAPARPASAANAKPATPAEDDFEKKTKPIPVPRMDVVGAYVDRKVLGKEGVREMAKLPRLDELRAQIIGLVGAPAMKLAGVLGAAAGGQLALTLEGYEKGLKEEVETEQK